MHELEAAKRLIFYAETKEKSCSDGTKSCSDLADAPVEF